MFNLVCLSAHKAKKGMENAMLNLKKWRGTAMDIHPFSMLWGKGPMVPTKIISSFQE